MIDVVSLYLNRNGAFLACRRPVHKARGNQWEFPGGKIEAGETPEQAIVREIREELGITILPEYVIAQTEYSYPDVSIRLFLIRATLLSGTPQTLEHSELRWVTLTEAMDMDFCPADRNLLKQLTQMDSQSANNS